MKRKDVEVEIETDPVREGKWGTTTGICSAVHMYIVRF